MKKLFLLLAIILMVIISIALWYYRQSSLEAGEKIEFIHFGIIILVIAFAVYIGIKRYLSLRRGEPAEDEMSKSILQKTAAISYYISLYLWVFILFIKDRTNIDTEQLIGSGILGMAIIYASIAVFLNFKGMKGD
jgi:peptidoglycan/LPS O-acetylase OafA/YrhL